MIKAETPGDLVPWMGVASSWPLFLFLILTATVAASAGAASQGATNALEHATFANLPRVKLLANQQLTRPIQTRAALTVFGSGAVVDCNGLHSAFIVR